MVVVRGPQVFWPGFRRTMGKTDGQPYPLD